jgi:hypothetical protein
VQLLPDSSCTEGRQCGITSKLHLKLGANESLLLAQPILQSREPKALVVLTDSQASTSAVHLFNLNRGPGQLLINDTVLIMLSGSLAGKV